jgi:hypothetical protein
VSVLDLVRVVCSVAPMSADDWPELRALLRDALALRFQPTSAAQALTALAALSALSTWMERLDLSIAAGKGADPRKLFREAQELVAALFGAALFVANDQLVQAPHLLPPPPISSQLSPSPHIFLGRSQCLGACAARWSRSLALV